MGAPPAVTIEVTRPHEIDEFGFPEGLHLVDVSHHAVPKQHHPRRGRLADFFRVDAGGSKRFNELEGPLPNDLQLLPTTEINSQVHGARLRQGSKVQPSQDICQVHIADESAASPSGGTIESHKAIDVLRRKTVTGAKGRVKL